MVVFPVFDKRFDVLNIYNNPIKTNILMDYPLSNTTVVFDNNIMGTNSDGFVNVTCYPTQPVKGFEFSFSFNPDLVQVVSIVEGDFFDGYISMFNDGVIDNVNGTVKNIYGLIVGIGNVTGNGSLVNINFNTLNGGISDLVFISGSCNVTDETSYLESSWVDGWVEVVSFAYDYSLFDIPKNSFGFFESVIKFVNKSFFWSFFENNTGWVLERSNKLDGEWVDVTSDDLDIGYVVNDSSISQKMFLNFTADATGYYRLNFTINQSCSDYFFDGISEYSLNVSIPDSNEFYIVGFNWSDIILNPDWYNFVEYDHGLVDDKFFFEVTITKKITNGQSVSIDPTFGYTGTKSSSNTIKNRITGAWATMGGVSGIADNMTIYMIVDTAAHNSKCALYYGNKTFYAETEEKSIGVGGPKWVTYNFLAPKPTVEAGKLYFLGAFGDATSGVNSIYYGSQSGYTLGEDNNGLSYPTFPNPTNPTNYSGYVTCIYCSYTEGGGEEQRTPTGVFNNWFLCGNESNRVPTEVFNYWFLCGNTSFRSPLNIFNYWFLCGNTSSRSPLEVFNYWFNCGNISYRTSTEVFNYWFLCGNTTNRNPIEVFNYWFLCGNTSYRTSTEVFNYWFNCGNTSYRQPYNVFNYWFLCGNTSSRSPLEVFNYWFLCGNGTNRQPFNVFNNWFLCGNESNRVPTEVFNYWFLCGNTSFRSPLNIFNYWFLCGNTSSRSPLEVFNYWFNCGNISYRTSTEVFNYWFNCSNVSGVETRTPYIVFDYYFKCGNSTNRQPELVFDYWFYCANESIPSIIISNIYPANKSINIPLQPVMYLTINSSTGQTMNITWYYGNSLDTCTHLLGSDNNIMNSTQNELNFIASNYSTNYYWRIMVDDGTTYQNYSYMFMTEDDIVFIGGGGTSPLIGVIGVIGILGFVFALSVTRRKKKKFRGY